MGFSHPMPDPRKLPLALERYTLAPGRYEQESTSVGPTSYLNVMVPTEIVVVGVRSKALDGWDQDSIQACLADEFKAQFPVDPPTSADGKDADINDLEMPRWLEIPIAIWHEVTSL